MDRSVYLRFVIRDLVKPLLGRPAIESLKLMTLIDSVSEDDDERMIKNHPKLFKGLGTLWIEYQIKLIKNAEPYVLTTPGRVPLPSITKVREELNHMEE